MENFIFVQFKWKFVSHLQSQVFGAGYRSLPTMSEEEYFQLELKQGKIVQEYNQWVEYNSFFNPLSANPPNWSNILDNSSAFADELFECVQPFCGVGT